MSIRKIEIGQVGRVSETRLAEQLGARLRPNSGAVAGAKGDMVLPEALIEAKSTIDRSMSVKHEWLAKIAGEARDHSRVPALVISFTHGNGKPLPSGQWAMIPLQEFQDYLLWLRTRE